MSPRLVLLPRESARPERRTPTVAPRDQPAREEETVEEANAATQRELDQLWWWAGF